MKHTLTNLFLATAAVTLLSVSCTEKEIFSTMPNGNGEGLTIQMTVPKGEVFTRATSSEHEEGRINNLCVLAFDNKTGDLEQRWLLEGGDLKLITDHSGKESDYALATIQVSNLREGELFDLFLIANYGEFNTIMNISREYVEQEISHINDLNRSISMFDEGKYIERGNSFLMTAMLENQEVKQNDEGTRIVAELERFDAKVKFDVSVVIEDINDGYDKENGYKPDGYDSDNVNDGFSHEDFEFRPLQWRVHNVPNSINLLNGAQASSETSYAISDWYNYEGQGSEYATQASFYILPTTIDPMPKGSILSKTNPTDPAFDSFSPYIKGISNEDLISGNIPNNFDHMNHLWFSLRDKHVPIAEGQLVPDYLQTRKFEHAPANAPYIEVKGTATFRADFVDSQGNIKPNQLQVADVTYFIHLGYDEIVDRPLTPEFDAAHKPDTKLPLTPAGFSFSPKIYNADDFDVDRNNSYNYFVRIRGLQHVELEAETGRDEDVYEEAPGVEGVIQAATQYERFNSAYQTLIFYVKDDFISPHMTWSISTPFGEWIGANSGFEGYTEETPLNNIDYQWIYFSLNKELVGDKYGLAYAEDIQNTTGEPATLRTTDNIDPNKHKRIVAPLRKYKGRRALKPDEYYDTMGDNDWTFHYGARSENPEFVTVGGEQLKPILSNWGKIRNAQIEGSTKTYWERANERMQGYITAWGTGEDRYINMRQLLSLLQLSKDNKSYNETNGLTYKINDSSTHTSGAYPTISDANGYSLFTAFINEYYYYDHPLKGNNMTDPEEPALWSKFTNKMDRNFSLIYSPKTTTDFTSAVVEATLSIDQAAIQTVYNETYAGTSWPNETGQGNVYGNHFISFGMEAIPDNTNRSLYGNSSSIVPSNMSTHANDPKSGLRNSQRAWLASGATKNSGGDASSIDEQNAWEDFINPKTNITFNHRHNTNAFECLRRNRDENGDGKINIEEIKWYTPAIGQFDYTWFGRNNLSTSSVLYQNRDWSTKITIYASSTAASNNATQAFWAHEGSSKSSTKDKFDTSAAAGIYPNDNTMIRCFRNLGTLREDDAKDLGSASDNKNAAVVEYVVPIYKSNRRTSTFDNRATNVGRVSREIETVNLPFFGNKAYRQFRQYLDLPEHHIFSDLNKPRTAFDVVKHEGADEELIKCDEITTNSITLDENVAYPAKTYNAFRAHLRNNDTKDDPCPPGWRMPTESELVIMVQLFGTGADAGWPTANKNIYYTRTYGQEKSKNNDGLQIDPYTVNFENLPNVNMRAPYLNFHTVSWKKEDLLSKDAGSTRCVRDSK